MSKQSIVRALALTSLLGVIGLGGPATAASVSCDQIEAWYAQGLSRTQVEQKVTALGAPASRVDEGIAELQQKAVEQARQSAERMQKEAERQTRSAAAAEESISLDAAPAPAAEPMEAAKRMPSQKVKQRPASRRPSPRPAPVANSYDATAAGGLSASPRAEGYAVRRDIGSEDYTDYGVGEMFLVENDALSTFSVDVDTASYAISRRKLNSGGLPPQASVRVEEFVNAFDYSYAPPRDGRPFSVQMEALANPEVGNHHILRVGVQGRELVGERKPVHLTFLVDVSGSMSSPDKLGLAKRALHELVDNLGVEDTVALATYAGTERIVLEPTYTTQKKTIHDAIEGLRNGGGTSMGSGMELAYRMASEMYLHGAENRVIVLSDGDANIGRTSHDEILSTIEHYAEEGITLTTVGLGMGNYKDTMMEQLANKGDGNYFYIDSFKEAQKVFGQDLSGTIQTIAKDVKIQVEFDPDAVHAYRLIGYENRDIADEDFRNDQVDAGEVGSGHQVTALYDVVLKDDAGPKDTIATVRLRAKNPGPDRPAKEYTWAVPVGEIHGVFADASRDSRSAWAVATFAEKLRGSPHAAEIAYTDIYRYAAGATDGSDDHRELLQLIDRAAQLSGEGSPVAAR
jgi:Ca-activated chloride channel family protein